jgi:signal transduction histidine kinase
MARTFRSVRSRLLVIALLPMLLVLPLLIGITMQRWIWRTDQILTARVASDLTVARQYLAHLTDSTAAGVAALGASAAFRDRIGPEPAAFLEESRRRLGLDYLVLGDATGSPALPARTGLAVLEAATLGALSPGLAERARVPHAGAAGGCEDRALVIHAVSPVTLPGGAAAQLSGGILLNNNTGFIDRINALVYPPPEGHAGVGSFDQGVTTLFLDDLRIATTLRPSGGERALGTRASAAVRDRVLIGGESWHDTAYVVNAWYISAYEALADPQGRRVGMLYTGIPRAPYTAARQVTWAVIGGAFALAAGLSLPLFLHWARGIFGPLEAMGRTMSRAEAGEMGAPTRVPAGGADEIVHLARHLDRLLGLLQQRDSDLRALNADLNRRVEARTADLTEANRALEAATRQLVLAEKLATIGEVTAGVAHEINNPLAVIQGNMEVLRLILEEQGSAAETEIALIDDQIRRIGALVNQLLQFARPEEFAGDPPLTDPATAAAGLRPLISHLLKGVTLVSDLRSTREVAMNLHALQQILVNLATNAVQAMPQGGRLALSTQDAAHEDGRPGVCLTLSDTGTGMDAQTLAHVFDPFFTTRGTRGTGLGLSICQALTARAGGRLSARSRPGEGTTFTLWLPAA